MGDLKMHHKIYKNNNVEFHDINYANDNVFEICQLTPKFLCKNDFKMVSTYEKKLRPILLKNILSNCDIPNDNCNFIYFKTKYIPAIINHDSIGFHCSFDCHFVHNDNIKRVSGDMNISTWVKIPHDLRAMDHAHGFDNIKNCVMKFGNLMWHPSIPKNERDRSNVILKWLYKTQY